MRKLVMLSAVAMLAFGVMGTASAAPLNCDGTLTHRARRLPQIGNTGGGVATVNASGGGAPATWATLTIKASRGGRGRWIAGRRVTDPVAISTHRVDPA